MRLLQFFCLAYILFLAPYGLTAQTDPIEKIPDKAWSQEIGVNVYSVMIREGDYYSDYKKVIDHFAVSGLYAKFYHGKNVIRTSVDYFQKVILDRFYYHSTSSRDISFKIAQVAIGYQRNFGKGKCMPYVFADLSGGFSKKLIQMRYDGFFIAYPGYNTWPSTITSSSLGLSPGIGLRLQLRKTMFLNLETAAEFFYLKGQDNFNQTYQEKGINLKPFKCSFGFIF